MRPHDLPDWEHRLRIVEDKLAIYELTASHPPSADTGGAGYAMSIPELRAGDMQSMLSDDEALEGVEAWLNQQPPSIKVGSRDPALATSTYVESPAGWLLRLVRHARHALAAPEASCAVNDVPSLQQYIARRKAAR